MLSLAGLSLILMFFLFLSLSVLLFNYLFMNSWDLMVFEWNIMGMTNFDMPLIFIFDKFSIIMSFTVVLITLSVMIFSKSYMKPYKFFSSFFLILMLFVASMLLLVLSPGTFSLFMGWDGLGLTSFLLVLFYSNTKSLGASILTVIANRIGDAFMLCSLGMIFYGISTVPITIYNFPTLESSFTDYYFWFFFMFIIGASTKSAQIPFSAWLPAAMAAPTPVSALVHSSTLVTAGVYVLVRFNFLFWKFNTYLTIVGALTTLMASFSALKEPDMKKIIALSTLSQLGIMVTALGTFCVTLSFFHLIAHAFFKALMFIGVGDFIHSSSDYQDLKVPSGLILINPLSGTFLVAAKMALCGIPFFSGFFSKEMILENMTCYVGTNILIYFYFFFSISLTLMYSTRFIMKTMISTNNFLTLKIFQFDKITFLAMLLLFIPGITGGMFFSYVFSEEMNLCFSPTLLKVLILSSMLMSVIIFKSISIKSTNFTRFSDNYFFMWMSPEGSMIHILTNSISSILMLNMINHYLDFSFTSFLKMMMNMFTTNMNFSSSFLMKYAPSLIFLIFIFYL